MAHYTCNVKVFREGKFEKVSSSTIVPGDVIEIIDIDVLPCDLILISGQCIINESMLSGEGVPVIKSALPNSEDIYNQLTDQKYTLYSGTKVIKTR